MLDSQVQTQQFSSSYSDVLCFAYSAVTIINDRKMSLCSAGLIMYMSN